MIDKFNRNIVYARLSVTDKCNFKCIYCMPDNDSTCINQVKDKMSDEDILKLCKALGNLGINTIKITGGEPLLRKNIIKLIEDIKSIDTIEKVTLTTNGLLLEKYVHDLKRIGIDGINISIDSVNEKKFNHIAGVNKYTEVIRAVKKAKEVGIENIKLNCVLIKDLNENEYIDIIKFADENKVSVKFIEMMPIGIGKSYTTFTLEELKEKIEQELGQVVAIDKKLGNGPAKYYQVKGLDVKIGFIGAISHKFCNECNRIRITSEGFLKTCLNYNTGKDLIPYINEDNLDEVIRKAILTKQESHKFEDKNNENDDVEAKFMSQIGG